MYKYVAGVGNGRHHIWPLLSGLAVTSFSHVLDQPVQQVPPDRDKAGRLAAIQEFQAFMFWL